MKKNWQFGNVEKILYDIILLNDLFNNTFNTTYIKRTFLTFVYQNIYLSTF